MADRTFSFSQSHTESESTSGGRLVFALNSITRAHLLQYKRVRRLKPPTPKTTLVGGDGIAFGADSLSA